MESLEFISEKLQWFTWTELHFTTGYNYVFIKEMPGHFLDTTTDMSYFPEDREYRVTMAEELRNLPIQGDYVAPPP